MLGLKLAVVLSLISISLGIPRVIVKNHSDKRLVAVYPLNAKVTKWHANSIATPNGAIVDSTTFTPANLGILLCWIRGEIVDNFRVVLPSEGTTFLLEFYESKYEVLVDEQIGVKIKYEATGIAFDSFCNAYGFNDPEEMRKKFVG